MVSKQPWDDLIPFLLQAGADADAALPRLRRYVELLISWNRNVSNLISRNDEGRIVAHHLREALEPARLLREVEADRWIDFGSGAGLPAIPLAIAGIGKRWTMVESRRPKALFMRKAMQELSMHGNEVVHSRLETWVAEDGQELEFDGFTSRATLALGPTLALAARIVRSGGWAFLWKGSKREQEMEADPRWRDAWELDGLIGVGDGMTVVARFIRK